MLSEILSKQDCADCRLCCKFDRYSLWLTPTVDAALREKISGYAPDVRFVPKGEYCLMRMLEPSPDEEAGLYSCPLLDERCGCIMGDDKPFECAVFPLRVVKKDERLAIALSPLCPVINKKSGADILAAVKKISPQILSFAKAHPECIRPLSNEKIILSEK